RWPRDWSSDVCSSDLNEDLALMPGMYAQVKFSLVPAEDVWVIPATALVARTAGPQVISVRPDGSVHYVSVQLGRDLGQKIEVVRSEERRVGKECGREG